MKNNILTTLLVMTLLFVSSNQSASFSTESASSEALEEKQWVDSIYNAMSFDERLGQLFMIRAHSDKGAEYAEKVARQIQKYHVGGLCFFQGTPEIQAKLTNQYQLLNRHVPLMIAMDAEWGLGMRMKASTISFPRQLTLGAIQDNRFIYEMGKTIAAQLSRTGVHINFAPVADVNNNAANPVINTRSFGEDRYNVAVKSYMYMKGMQDHGVMACAKHFPGHGDTDVDSHLDLPIIKHSKERLDSVELYPFQVLAEQGIGSFMVAHLSVPTFEKRPNRPTSLSRPTVTGLLREEMGYDGLIFTDALEMKGVTKYFEPGEVEAEALLAGNDVLCLPEDIAASLEKIKEYIDDGKISEAQVEASVKRVLRAKYQLGLTSFTPIPEENIREELNNSKALALKQQLFEQAITLVRNSDDLLPFRKIDSLKIASLALGTQQKTVFQKRLEDYKSMPLFQTDKNITTADARSLMQQLDNQEIVIVSLHDLSSYANKGYGISETEINFIQQLAARKKIILVNFGSPYALKYFDNLQWVINAYDEDELAQDVAAQALFGAIPMRGRLPVTASSLSRFNTGITTNPTYRLGFSYPESVGLNADTLKKIDALMEEAINGNATPGGVVLVAKDGKIVYKKAFGYHTTARLQKVNTENIYDLASVTKIAAATISVMKLQEQSKISIYQPLGRYLKDAVGTNKADLTLFDIMAHRAGLKSWIPFYEQTITESSKGGASISSNFYSRRPTGNFQAKVTDQLYLRKDFQDNIWQQIYASEVSAIKDYVYSDLGYYMVAEMIKQQTKKSIDEYVQETFYQPLGLTTMTYNPLGKFDKSVIVPTEEDRYWRDQKIHGYVHDMGAAMLDGVSGHAGLFANAQDVAVIMQMLLNMGYYGGQQYLNPATVQLFTTRHPDETRRGIGFDMLELSPDKDPNLSTKASDRTFGHLGFTGTATWADPEHNLIFVLLTNRTYPSMKNYKFNTLDYRPRIQTIVYNALEQNAMNFVEVE